MKDDDVIQQDVESKLAEWLTAQKPVVKQEDLESKLAEWRRGWKERLAHVREDPRWAQVEATVHRYAAVAGGYWQRDGYGSYWVPDHRAPEATAESLREIRGLRDQLAEVYNAEAVQGALGALVEPLLDGPDWRHGTDCDGRSFYEPYGRPSSEILKATDQDRMRPVPESRPVGAAGHRWRLGRGGDAQFDG